MVDVGLLGATKTIFVYNYLYDWNVYQLVPSTTMRTDTNNMTSCVCQWQKGTQRHEHST